MSIRHKTKIRQNENTREKTTNRTTYWKIRAKWVRHRGFKAVILTSAGIGKQYTENKHKTNKNKYQEDKTDETYRLT